MHLLKQILINDWSGVKEDGIPCPRPDKIPPLGWAGLGLGLVSGVRGWTVAAAEDQPWWPGQPELQHSSVFVPVSPPRNQSSTFLNSSEVIIRGPVYHFISTCGCGLWNEDYL